MPMPIFDLWGRTVLSVFAMLFLSVIVSGEAGRYHTDDVLAYGLTGSPGGRLLTLYDSHTRIHAPLRIKPFTTFQFSRDGRIAFSTSNDGRNYEIHIFDTQSGDHSPINLSQEININGGPAAWSPDGRYLAFVSQQDNRTLIYIWDGETVTDITPTDRVSIILYYSDVAWSHDGHLAFSAQFEDSDGSQNHEIYLWDGNTTANLSQNPQGDDRGPTWNNDGQVAFLSVRDGEYDIFVWDGVSVKDGMPDIDTFTNVAPELTGYYTSFPIWTADGFLAFQTSTPEDSHFQIFLWDGQTATNISQNPGRHNRAARWSSDGRWAFSTVSSSQDLIYIRDSENHTILTVEGYGTPIWSSDGHLMFCNRSAPSLSVSVWDGQKITEITQTDLFGAIVAQWQGGPGFICSSEVG